MPFTFAHPVIAIPLKKRWPVIFNGTALVFGSMAPDFEYFMRFDAQGNVGHTLAGLFYFDLPLVLIAALLWHYIIKKPLIMSMPNFFQYHFKQYLNDKWGIRSLLACLSFLISALVGIASHVFWDAFTHESAFFVLRMAFLSSNLGILGVTVPVYKILQHGSTLLGLLVIFAFILKSNQDNDTVATCTGAGKWYSWDRQSIVYWASVMATSICVVASRLFIINEKPSISHYGTYIVSSISGVIIAVIIVSAIFGFFNVYRE